LTSRIRIATRPSRLALAQTELALAAIRRVVPGIDLEVVPIKSEGDARPAEPLRAFGDKAAFVARIEEALITGEADIAIHSLKDLPTEITTGLWLPTFLPREDPRDVLVSASGAGLRELAAGSRVGTSSLRRLEQLRIARRDLAFLEIRGNVDTRLRKLEAGEYDAIVLAAAGLRRLGLESLVTEYLDTADCVPAPGQGIIAVQCRENYEFGEELMQAGDATSAAAAHVERSLARAVGATCASSFGALAGIGPDTITLAAWFRTPHGSGRSAAGSCAPGGEVRLIGDVASTLLA
jgi:hydroxymethylbilane synthase